MGGLVVGRRVARSVREKISLKKVNGISITGGQRSGDSHENQWMKIHFNSF
jgi:hypothetical protein